MNITGSFSSWPLSKGVYPVPVGFKLAAHGRRVLEDRSHGRAYATVTTADRHTGNAHPYMKTRRCALLRSQANWWPVLWGTVTASTPEAGPSQPWARAAGLPALRLRSEDWVALLCLPHLWASRDPMQEALFPEPDSPDTAPRRRPAGVSLQLSRPRRLGRSRGWIGVHPGVLAPPCASLVRTPGLQA